jgi:hypothetical protein
VAVAWLGTHNTNFRETAAGKLMFSDKDGSVAYDEQHFRDGVKVSEIVIPCS